MLKSILSIPLFILWFFYSAYIIAQVQQLPYTESFESDFALSPTGCIKEQCEVEFISNWRAPEVKKSSRIFRDTNFYTGEHSLAFIPIAIVSPEINLSLNPLQEGALSISLYASQSKNGKQDDTRSAIMKISISYDNGNSFINETIIDTFRNEIFEKFKRYNVAFEVKEKLTHPLQIKIQVKRLTLGMGSAAKVLLDDVHIELSPISAVENVDEPEKIHILKNEGSVILLNKSVNGNLYNLLNANKTDFKESDLILKSTYESGIYLLLTDEGEKLKLYVD